MDDVRRAEKAGAISSTARVIERLQGVRDGNRDNKRRKTKSSQDVRDGEGQEGEGVIQGQEGQGALTKIDKIKGVLYTYSFAGFETVLADSVTSFCT